jgi:hypothetical protein
MRERKASKTLGMRVGFKSSFWIEVHFLVLRVLQVPHLLTLLTILLLIFSVASRRV